jgi:hypothetical protein
MIRGLISWMDRQVDVPADVLRQHIEDGDVLEWLPVATEPPVITLEPLTESERRSFQRTLEEHHRRDTGGSYGVTRSGAALMIAWLAHDIDRMSSGSEPFG